MTNTLLDMEVSNNQTEFVSDLKESLSNQEFNLLFNSDYKLYKYTIKVSESSSEELYRDYLTRMIKLINYQSKNIRGKELNFTIDFILDTVPLYKEDYFIWPNISFDDNGSLILFWISKNINLRITFLENHEGFYVKIWNPTLKSRNHSKARIENREVLINKISQALVYVFIENINYTKKINNEFIALLTETEELIDFS